MHVLRHTCSSLMCEWDIKLLWFQVDWNTSVAVRIHCMHIVYIVFVCVWYKVAVYVNLSIFYFKYTNTTVAYNRLIQEENLRNCRFIDLVFSIFGFKSGFDRLEHIELIAFIQLIVFKYLWHVEFWNPSKNGNILVHKIAYHVIWKFPLFLWLYYEEKTINW